MSDQTHLLLFVLVALVTAGSSMGAVVAAYLLDQRHVDPPRSPHA